MKVFQKVLIAMQGRPQNGHALANAKNKITLAQAKKDIEKKLTGIALS